MVKVGALVNGRNISKRSVLALVCIKAKHGRKPKHK
jgi:hypothetical protein